MRQPTTSRDFVLPLALAGAGALGAVPGSEGGSDPVALVVWIALVSLSSGFAMGSSGRRHWALDLLPPAAWMGIVALVDGSSPRDLPSPAFAALAWTGLYAAGLGLGRTVPGRELPGSAGILLAAVLLAALPIVPGFLGGPLPPAAAARLLDLSPATLVAECAGLDWMRHPALYGPAGTADIDPALRVPFDGALAGPIAFVVGCALALGGTAAARARSGTQTPGTPTQPEWPSTSTSAPSRRT